MSREMRKLIDLINRYNKMERVLLSISQFGPGFEAKGVLIQHSLQGRPDSYYVPADAEVTDSVMRKCENLSEDEILETLVKAGILKLLPKK